MPSCIGTLCINMQENLIMCCDRLGVLGRSGWACSQEVQRGAPSTAATSHGRRESTRRTSATPSSTLRGWSPTACSFSSPPTLSSPPASSSGNKGSQASQVGSCVQHPCSAKISGLKLGAINGRCRLLECTSKQMMNGWGLWKHKEMNLISVCCKALLKLITDARGNV